MKRNLNVWVWSTISFALSLFSSSTGGRALWCDEILRINGQHYTIDQLLAFKHLHDFCTQTPTGYLFMRPFQLLLGYEFGGNLVAAFSAAIITACVLLVLRRYNGGSRPSPFACAIVALNPLLIYYGSELSFYGMFAAAFAISFALALTLDDAMDFKGMALRHIGFVVAGAFFVTFHFAGMFVWAGFSLALCVDCLCRFGFRRAFNRALLLLIPMVVNIPMYIGAEGKAIHLGTQHVAWEKLPGLPSQLWHYVCTLFPSFTGGWVLGVLVFCFGIGLMLRDRKIRHVALIALAAILSVLFFLSYSGLHDYVPTVARYWVYALAPALFITAFAIDWICARARWIGAAVASIVVVADLMVDSVTFFAEGRNYPYLEFVRAVPTDAPAVVYVNHYETRFFGRYYALPHGVPPTFPSYWEQGETVRAHGLKMIHEIAPLCPVYIQDEAQERMTLDSGWTAGMRIDATMPLLFPVVKMLHLNPEPANAATPSLRLFVPQESELFAKAEAKGKPVFVPGKGWRLASIPPKKMDQPFTPVLTLAPGKRAELKVYVPKSFGGNKLTLTGYLGHGRSAASPYSVQLDAAKKGGYVSAIMDGGKDGCFFLYPQVK